MLRAFPNSGPNLRPLSHTAADRFAPHRSGERLFDAPLPVALWHMASLDAPTVAMIWTLGFAFAAGVRLPLWAPALVGLVTWAIYIGDRLLDARSALASMQPSRLRHRHCFHWRHRRMLASLAVASAAIALAIVVVYVPVAAREHGGVLGFATVAYFSGVHARRNPGARWGTRWGWLPTSDRILARLPFVQTGNEMLVAAIFTCGCLLPVWPRAAQLHAPLWPLGLVGAFFMLLVWLNYHTIGRWEAGAAAAHVSPAGFMVALLGGAFAASIWAVHPSAAIIVASGASSAFLLALLNRNRSMLTPLALRASADLVLILPMPLLVPMVLMVHSALPVPLIAAAIRQ